jgi:uncharacterized membrane protein YgcG
MNNPVWLLGSAALLAPIAPAVGQPVSQQSATPAAAAPPVTAQPSTTTPAAAPAAQPVDDTGDDEEIVVTGQRARGSVVGDIPPENTLDARDVRATGATSINDLLDALAPQIGSVRGRGSGAPVLLLNGQRISGFRELRDIPTEAISRVEILPEEVALKYGYSADQKVVNIVLRQRFRSTTAQVGGGLATQGGYGTGNADVTRLLIQRKGRTTFNLHAEGNTLLTEAERNILLDPTQIVGTPEQELESRSLVGSKRDVRGSATINRNMFTNGSATINTELEHTDGRSLIGFNPSLLDPLARTVDTNTAHVGAVLNDTTKSQWRLTLTGNGDLGNTITDTDRANVIFPTERARSTTESADLTGTANGNILKLPAGHASTTLTLGASTVHLDSERTRLGAESSTSLSRTLGQAGVNFDVPISRRGRDFRALGNLTVNANAHVEQLSDFGTLTKIGAGLNWSPADRLNLLTSYTREEGPPSIDQLGDPVLDTPNSRIFDFTTGQTVEVEAITGGNPNLQSDRRHVLKVSGNWQPLPKTDLKFRADFVHQTIDDPISNITVTPQVEAAFPDRFVRAAPLPGETIGRLVSVDLRPINFESSRRDQLRIGFDFTHPLKSHRPSQAVINQIRSQFGFGQRGPAGSAGGPGTTPAGSAPGAGPNGAPPGGSPLEGAGARPEGGRSDSGGRGFGGFGGGGGGGGRGGGGFFGGAGGGQSRGRIITSVTDTITFVDKVQIAPGVPGLDFLHGDATGSGGGTPRHNVQAQLMYFNNGLGARVGTNWKSATDVRTFNGDRLRFSPVGTFNLSLFANPGDIPEVSVKHPWLRGTQVRFEINNVFNTRPSVHSALGNPLLNFQPDLLDPIGRTVMITFRKLFVPSPATIRRLFQQERQQGGATR